MSKKISISTCTQDISSGKVESLYIFMSWNLTRLSDCNRWPMNSVFQLISLIDNCQNLFLPEDYLAKSIRLTELLRPIQVMRETSITKPHSKKEIIYSTKSKNSQEPLMYDLIVLTCIFKLFLNIKSMLFNKDLKFLCVGQ